MSNILDVASKQLVTVELTGVGGWNSQLTLKGAPAVLAKQYGGLESSYKGGKLVLLPPGYDEEYNALRKAHSAVRATYYDLTMPFGNTFDAKKGKKRAEGKRAALSGQISDDSLASTIDTLRNAEAEAREAFANAIEDIVDRLEASGDVGLKFDRSLYPTPSEIRQGWFYNDIRETVEPILNADSVKNLGLPDAVASIVEEGMARRVASQVMFGQQQMVEETIEYVRNMVNNLTKLRQHYNDGKGKRPAIFDSLVDNVRSSLTKLRTYALPGTLQGDELIQLVDNIEARLDVQNLSADVLRSDAGAADRALAGATEASKLLDAWGGVTEEFDTTPEPAVEASAPEPTVADEIDPPEPAVVEAHVQDEPPVSAPADDDDIDDLLAGW